MNEEENRRKENAFDRIKVILEEGKIPNKSYIDTVLKYREYLSEEEEKEFEKMLQLINKMHKREEKKQSKINLKKEKFFMRIPIIKEIYKAIQSIRRNEHKDLYLSEGKNNEELNSKIVEKERFLKELKHRQSIENETLVISDLHGDFAKWECARLELISNPTSKLIILGDAMDRQEYGVEILLEIQQLSESGRVQYLPGNHDMFAYSYIVSKNKTIRDIAQSSLELNGGQRTIDKLNSFDEIVSKELKEGRIQRKVTLQQFMNWLGNQPIQTIRRENGIDYALAHAIFDTKLYKFNKNFCLKDALEMQMKGGNDEFYQRFKNVIWYRENDDNTHYAPISWPENFVMVVGHTPQVNINMRNLENSKQKNIVYVDCGKRNLQCLNLKTGDSEEIEPQIINEEQRDTEQKGR